MNQLSGGCHCGNIRVVAELSRAPGAYNPRSCDCDFCRKHSAAYVSDRAGSLRVWIMEEQASGKYRQGSGAADCLLCRKCGVLIGVFYQCGESLYAAMNVKILKSGEDFGDEVSVSPQNLSAAERARRWQDIWFSDVQVDIADDSRLQ